MILIHLNPFLHLSDQYYRNGHDESDNDSKRKNEPVHMHSYLLPESSNAPSDKIEGTHKPTNIPSPL